MDRSEKIYTACKMTASSAVLGLAWRHFCAGGPGLIFWALGLCWWGDLALALSGEWHNRIQPRPFAWGVACFAAAQLLFCAAFWQKGSPVAAGAVGAGLAAVLAWAMMRRGLVDFGPLKPILLPYTALVGAMAVSALGLLPHFPQLALAGCAFAASDCGIALRSFSIWRHPLWGALILPLYYAAVLILACLA